MYQLNYLVPIYPFYAYDTRQGFLKYHIKIHLHHFQKIPFIYQLDKIQHNPSHHLTP